MWSKCYLHAVLTTCLFCLIKISSADEICCAGNICFDDHPPFNGLPLPECAEDLNIHLTLYTRNNRDRGTRITRDTIPSEFDNSKLTIFYTHGWLGSDRNDWLENFKDNTLIRGDYNVIIVGWQRGSQQIWYPKSASDTRSVGTEIGLVAQNLVNNGGLDRKLTYCVGHSLGGHVCGHAGNYFKFGRITGMDPAGPLFESRDLICGLNPNSADLVDVIHTNGEPSIVLNLGTMRILGHVDFYPNGGAKQPECILDPLQYGQDLKAMADLLPACSHFRAVQYFGISILSPCFRSNQRCTDQYSLPKSCATSPNTVQVMGFDSNQYPEKGIFHLATTGNEPYCLGVEIV